MLTWQDPQPGYPEYPELRAEADRRARGFVDPSKLGYHGIYQQVADRRGFDWCLAVLGHFPGIDRLTHAEAELLVVADEHDIDPPLPEAILEARAAGDQRRQDAAARRLAATERDAAAWRDVLAAAPAVAGLLRVFQNTTARARHGYPHHLGHAVAAVPLYSGTRKVRVHPAGRALCESLTRPRPLLLESTPTSSPATCDRCLAWTPKVRPAR